MLLNEIIYCWLDDIAYDVESAEEMAEEMARIDDMLDSSEGAALKGSLGRQGALKCPKSYIEEHACHFTVPSAMAHGHMVTGMSNENQIVPCGRY